MEQVLIQLLQLVSRLPLPFVVFFVLVVIHLVVHVVSGDWAMSTFMWEIDEEGVRGKYLFHLLIFHIFRVKYPDNKKKIMVLIWPIGWVFGIWTIIFVLILTIAVIWFLSK